MRRDMELVRLILLRVEAEGVGPHDWLEDFQVEGYSQGAVSYHVWLLWQAGFLAAFEENALDDEFVCYPACLRWEGVEFLESVRDPEVWRKTKAGVSKAGVAGVELIWSLAKVYAKQRLSETLGVPL